MPLGWHWACQGEMGELANGDLLGQFLIFFPFWPWLACLLKRSKMQLKNWAEVEFFEAFFSKSRPEVASLVAVSTCQKVTKAIGMGLIGCKKQH